MLYRDQLLHWISFCLVRQPSPRFVLIVDACSVYAVGRGELPHANEANGKSACCSEEHYTEETHGQQDVDVWYMETEHRDEK